MKIFQLFIQLDDQQHALLSEKYKDDVMIKTFFKTVLDNAAISECIKIKNEKEKAERILNQPEKL